MLRLPHGQHGVLIILVVVVAIPIVIHVPRIIGIVLRAGPRIIAAVEVETPRGTGREDARFTSRAALPPPETAPVPRGLYPHYAGGASELKHSGIRYTPLVAIFWRRRPDPAF